MDDKKRLANCDFVKTILMLFVVAYHSILFWNGKWFAEAETLAFKANELSGLAEIFNTFHIYGFALVSGYIFRYIKIEKGGYSKFLPFIKKKFMRLVVPYLFVAIVWVVPVAVYFFNYGLQTVFQRYVLMIAPNQLWFLIMLFNVFWISYLMADFWEKHSFWGFSVAVLLYGIGIVGNIFLKDVFQIWTSCIFVIYFWVGFYLRKNSDGFLWKVPTICYILIVGVIFVALKYVDASAGFVFKLINRGGTGVMRLGGAIGAFIILQRLASKIKWNNRVFRFISGNSMVVYLLHQQLIYCTLSWLNGVLNPWVHAGVNFIFSLGVSLLLAHVLKKSNTMCLLLGEKHDNRKAEV